MSEYLTEAQSWWQGLSSETQGNIRIAGILFVAFVAGNILGRMTFRLLNSRNFDAALRLPGSAASPPETPHGITPSFLAGWLVCLTVWGGAAWWFAGHLGRTDVAERLSLVMSRTWAVAGILVVILAVASVLARRLADALRDRHPAPDAASAGRYGAAPKNGLADGAAAAVYVLVALVVLLITADMFDWPLTRSSAQALWQLAQKLLTVAATLLIGLLGARWARDIVAEPTSSAEKRAGQYTGLGIVVISLVLSLGVLLSNAHLMLGIMVIAILGLAVWLCRGYLPDIMAGLQLRAQKIHEVWFDGAAWQVSDIGFLTTQVCKEGAVHSVRNRVVLDARMHGTAQVAAR